MPQASFQSTVNILAGFGVVGELYNSAPSVAQSLILNSASAANNVFGRAFTIQAQGNAQAGNPGGAIFAGIMAMPKQNASFGDPTYGPLSPTITLNNYEQADFVTQGMMNVYLPNNANIGDVVIYNNTTGVLSSQAPGTPLPAGYSNAYAQVYSFNVTGSSPTPGLAVIWINPSAPTLVDPTSIIAPTSITWSGSGATLVAAVTGVLAGDLVVATIDNPSTQAASLLGAKVTATNQITFTLSAANTSNDATITYEVFRKV